MLINPPRFFKLHKPHRFIKIKSNQIDESMLILYIYLLVHIRSYSSFWIKFVDYLDVCLSVCLSVCLWCLSVVSICGVCAVCGVCLSVVSICVCGVYLCLSCLWCISVSVVSICVYGVCLWCLPVEPCRKKE